MGIRHGCVQYIHGQWVHQKHSISQIIKELKIKTIVKYYLIPVRRDIIKRMTKLSSLVKDWSKMGGQFSTRGGTIN